MANKMATKRPAVFFDRDGTLNVDTGYLHEQEKLQWMPEAQKAVKYVNDRGYLAIVITNQSGVARGYYPESDIMKLYDWMNADLVKYGFLEKCEVAYGGYGLDKPGCKLPIGILKFDFYDDARYGVLGWFAITFTDSKSCVAFSSVDWIHSIPIEWLRSGGGINIGSIQLNEDEALSITMSDIIQGCKECDEEGACSFRIFINGDI